MVIGMAIAALVLSRKLERIRKKNTQTRVLLGYLGLLDSFFLGEGGFLCEIILLLKPVVTSASSFPSGGMGDSN